jgi:heme/copper-type cytochrome/quinol oxidase subunit 2
MAFILICILVVCVLALCTSHWKISERNRTHTLALQRQIRNAADMSISASNTINPIISLIDIIRAFQTIDVLHSIYGKDNLYSMTNMDTGRMYDIIDQQKIKVTGDVMKAFPKFMPNHPLLNDAGITPEDSS